MENRFASIPEVTLAYIAGLVDGEGTISIRRNNRGKGKEQTEEYGPMISVSQKNREILDWLKSVVQCGSVVKSKASIRDTFSGKYRTWDCHHWEVKYDAAYQLVCALRPHLRIKHQQSDLLIEFQELKRSFRERNLKGMKGRLSTPPELMEKYRELVTKIQALNGRISK